MEVGSLQRVPLKRGRALLPYQARVWLHWRENLNNVGVLKGDCWSHRNLEVGRGCHRSGCFNSVIGGPGCVGCKTHLRVCLLYLRITRWLQQHRRPLLLTGQ